MNEVVVLYSEFKELETWHFTPFSTKVREAQEKLGKLEYPLIKLGEVASVFRGYARVDPTLEDGIPVITARNVAEATFSFENHQAFVSQEDHLKWSNSAVKLGDVLLNLYVLTTSNLAAVYEGKLEANLPSNIARIVVNPAQVLPHFLAQFFNSSIGRAILEQHAVGAVRIALTLRALTESILIPLPPLEEQERLVVRNQKIWHQAQQKQNEAQDLIEQADDLFDIQ